MIEDRATLVGVNRATLVGVISPTGVDGFCIPVFAWRKNSNHLLVQIVDEGGQIVEFQPFFSDRHVEQTDLSLERSIGDKAFWYFAIKGAAIFGTAEEIRSKTSSIKNLEDNPYVRLQISTACANIEQQDAASMQVFNSLTEDVGTASASAWLDANVLTPKIRTWLSPSAKTKRISSNIFAITSDRKLTIIAPTTLDAELSETEIEDLKGRVSALVKNVGITFNGFKYIEIPGAVSSVNVPQQKRDAVAAFGMSKGISFTQITKSYFEDTSDTIRVVCTFSSRYVGKGKRKYWFGFHETWNQWLEGAKEGYAIFGLLDVRLCFVLPLGFVRSQLPNLRTTGSGSDKYWHIDIVDTALGKNLLDVPKLKKAIPISQYALKF